MAAPPPHRRYFDHNASTPVSPAVARVMAAALKEGYANPSSPHRPGAHARYLVEKARRSIQKSLGASQYNVIFTSGGTESINLAIAGRSCSLDKPPKLIVGAADHKAAIQCVRAAWARNKKWISHSIVPVDRFGCPLPEALDDELTMHTRLVSLLLANNETGGLCDPGVYIPMIRRECIAPAIHLDAVQAPGRLPLNLDDLDVDMVSISGHKCHGPKGIGVLLIRPGTETHAMNLGGDQELGARAGTENIAGIVGLARALEDLPNLVNNVMPRIRKWRDELAGQLVENFGALIITPLENSLPNTLSVAFPGHSSREMIRQLDDEGFACSSGSACTSSDEGPSHVLKAIGLDDEVANSVVRFSFGRGNRRVDIQDMVDVLAHILKKGRR